MYGSWNRLLREGLGCPESYGVDVWGGLGETPQNHAVNIHGGFGGIIVIKNFQVVFSRYF